MLNPIIKVVLLFIEPIGTINKQNWPVNYHLEGGYLSKIMISKLLIKKTIIQHSLKP